MKSILISSLLVLSFLVEAAETSEVNSVQCRPFGKILRPRGVTIEVCYNDAKKLIKDQTPNEGSFEVYKGLLKKEDKTSACATFLESLNQTYKESEFRDNDIFENKGHKRATLDEAYYFYNECDVLAKSAKPAEPAASSTAPQSK